MDIVKFADAPFYYPPNHEGVTAPILLFHGIHDQFVPAAASEAFARALPDQVTLVRIEHANHVEAWNDPARCPRCGN